MAEKLKSSRSSWIKFVPLLIVGLMLAALFKQQAIYDQIRLLNYEAPASIAELAENSAMTDAARRIYYVNRPELASRDEFADYCPNSTEQTVVLGCYLSGQRGIYLLQVDNQELDGIEEVTAAHEMLHAAYDRLSSSERSRINKLLEDFYKTQSNNQQLTGTINEYKDSEPDEIVNEMHSIFPTQSASLSAELEEYYGRYFTDRSKVVDLYARYEAAFTSRQKQIEQYDALLNTYKSQIDELQLSVDEQKASLDSLKANLDKARSSDNIAAYNAGVDAYNRAVNRYNSEINRLKVLIDSHNALVTTRNDIAFEERQLVEALSSQ